MRLFRVVLPFIGLVLCGTTALASAQSIELVAGHQRGFADIQFLRLLPEQRQVSVFSRTRVNIDSTERSDVFSGLYLSYTSRHKLGFTLLGKAGGNGVGLDGGVHLLHTDDRLTLFALAALEFKEALGASWFSILRYRVPWENGWHWYSSLEIFSYWQGASGGVHRLSLQRLRLGLEKKSWAFGFASETLQLGREWRMDSTASNLGIFVRRGL